MNKPNTNQQHGNTCPDCSSKIPSNSGNGPPPDESIFLWSINSNFNKRRYIQMKHLAARAMKREKIFAMYGNCQPVRKALIARGWVEKLSLSSLDVSKIPKTNPKGELQPALERVIMSILIAKAKPNFIWNVRDDMNIEGKHRNFNAKYNRLEISHLWATKLGLCASLKNDCWFYIEDVAEVNSPRTYTCADKADLNDFKSDFKLTACTSLLKWLLAMVEKKQPVFQESGNVTINVIVFAINRCKEYLFRKQNKDIDKNIMSRVSIAQWNAFLKNYYTLIARQDMFKIDKDNKVPLFLMYAKFLLQEIYKYRPQLNCEGYHNIWIIKPGHCSRGRGIRLASKIGVLIDLMTKGKYVAQKYIEEPLLIHGTKFDIRQYYLVTNTCPLELWMYKECYLKFSSQKFSLINYHESIHLTNNAVQRKYTNCKDRHPELPKYNMWSSDTFKEYLKSIDMDNVWDAVIYPGMKKSIVGIMTRCQESIAHCVNRFELYGCDFILDKGFRPWLIEINSSPDFSPTTPVTAAICPAVLSDTIKVVIDHAADVTAPTGKFECIYRQPHSKPQPDAETDKNLKVYGRALSNDYFYKGNVPLIGTNSVTSAGKPNDITAMLKRLKMLHEGADSTKKSDDNSNCRTAELKKKTAEYDFQNPDFHENINLMMSTISEQIDALLEQIPSYDSSSTKNGDKKQKAARLCPTPRVYCSSSKAHNISAFNLEPRDDKSTSDLTEEKSDQRLIEVTSKLFSFLTKIDQD